MISLSSLLGSLFDSPYSRIPWLLLAGLLFLPEAAWAGGSSALSENLLWLAIILMAVRLFSRLVTKLGVPAVLGQLIVGFAAGHGVRHRIVGGGMVPRGEAGLISAMAAKPLSAVNDATPLISIVTLTILVMPCVLAGRLAY